MTLIKRFHWKDQVQEFLKPNVCRLPVPHHLLVGGKEEKKKKIESHHLNLPGGWRPQGETSHPSAPAEVEQCQEPMQVSSSSS